MNTTKLAVSTMISIFFLIGSNQAFAIEKIAGAFGLKFGDEIDSSSSVISEKYYNKVNDSYDFTPKKPFRSFSTYLVSITPKTRLIYRIHAAGVMENNSACTDEQKVIMSLLEKKYGKTEVDNIIAQEDPMMTVAVNCSGDSKVSIYINYMDFDLSFQSEKERLEIEGEKVDSSGL